MVLWTIETVIERGNFCGRQTDFFVSCNKASREVKSGLCEVSVCKNKGEAPMYAVCPEKNVGFVGRELDVMATLHSKENVYYAFGESKSAAKKKLAAILNLFVSDKEDELKKSCPNER